MQSFVHGRDKLAPYADTAGVRRRDLLTFAALGLIAGAPGSAIAAGPDGQLTWGVHRFPVNRPGERAELLAVIDGTQFR